MSDHRDLEHFLKSLDKMLDSIGVIVHTVRCKIRVEQEIANGTNKLKEEFSAPEKPAATSVVSGQGGPEQLLQGTTREKSRLTQEAEKVLVRGGRMEAKKNG